MASESTEERTRSVTLSAPLDDWLENEAERLGVDPNVLLGELVAAYRMASDSDELSLADSEQLAEATSTVQKQLTDRIENLESEYRTNLEDVRKRVVQVKKEADKKAPADHDHEALSVLPEVETQLETLTDEFERLQSDYDATVPKHDETISEFEERIETLEERLQTVAWVVSDLRETLESGGGLTPVDRIKRAAAKADIERAKCENCGESVAIALLTDPECPHCEAAVGNVAPASGWFDKPKLRVASQLESGEDS